MGNASAAIGRSSSCYSSEDEANNSEELNGGDGTSTSTSPKGSMASPNSNGKMRAGRGSATDPQSLYARVGEIRFEFLIDMIWPLKSIH